jgi:hypothetical protein
MGVLAVRAAQLFAVCAVFCVFHPHRRKKKIFLFLRRVFNEGCEIKSVTVAVVPGSPAIHEMDVLASGSIIYEYRRTALLADKMVMVFKSIRICSNAMDVAAAAAYCFAADPGKPMVMPVVPFLGKLCAAYKFVYVPLFFRSIRTVAAGIRTAPAGIRTTAAASVI